MEDTPKSPFPWPTVILTSAVCAILLISLCLGIGRHLRSLPEAIVPEAAAFLPRDVRTSSPFLWQIESERMI